METSIATVTKRRTPAIWLIRAFGIWAALVGILMGTALFTTDDPIVRAELGMSLGLFLGWIILGGLITLAIRNRARHFMRRFARHWRLAFVIFAIIMALIEEAITTTLTNTAPLWGIPLGKAYITASANYLEVVLYHSVVVFVPMFIVWAWLLKRYAFHPNTAFLLYGLTGVLSETLTFGTQNLVAAGFWVYVYGLMVYLPAYATPPERDARRPGFGAHLLALVLPIVASIPVALVIIAINPPQHAFAPLMTK